MDSPRICPHCGYVDFSTPGQRILCVFNGKSGRVLLGGCDCPICDGRWIERAYPDGTVENVMIERGT